MGNFETVYIGDFITVVNIANEVELIEGDMTDLSSLIRALRVSSPSEVYNLAAQSFVGTSWEQPVFSSKLVAGQVGMQLARKYGINMIHLRPFNHFGPDQKQGFVISDFSSQIALVEAGFIDPVIKVGNLEAWRDCTDVRDIVHAFVLLMEKEGLENGIYNVSSGIARKIGDILKELISKASTSIEIVVDPTKYRPNEVERFAGSNSKIQEAIGWTPNHDFEESLWDTLDWWRSMQRETAEQV